jgi:hypothetical protein
MKRQGGTGKVKRAELDRQNGTDITGQAEQTGKMRQAENERQNRQAE